MWCDVGSLDVAGVRGEKKDEVSSDWRFDQELVVPHRLEKPCRQKFPLPKMLLDILKLPGHNILPAMPKRTRNEEEQQSPTVKKARVNGIPPPPEEIHYARQLQDLLTFSQDGLQQLRHGIASFKAFLESILYRKNDDDRARQLSILHEYLDTQKPDDVKDTERPFFSQLWQAWSFASQNDDERLCSIISSLFTLLLKTLSSLIDFREHGFILCRTILQHHHLRLIKRCLDAPKHKDFLIAPCLRLLTELVSFDGGVLAKETYKRREQTFDPMTLRRSLGLTRADTKDEEDARRRPAIRTLTIRYILAHLKYLHEGGKIDILKSRPLCSSLFQLLRDDPADVIIELLSATEQNVLKDSELPRSSKAALLIQQNLERVTEIATRSEEGHAATERAFQWLKVVCSNPAYGVLRSSGWYPPGTSRLDPSQSDADTVDLGLDSIEFYDRDTRPNVRNTTLLGWIQTLRSHSNIRERELVLSCFSSAPELVAAYFSEKNMQLEPKLSNTWIGYASFLFEVVQLDVPEFLGHENEFAELPPQTNVTIESILPQPLTQKILTRCLNQNSEMITFFAFRLLVLAFAKVSCVQSLFLERARAAPGKQNLWQEASDRLLAHFISKCPSAKDVVAAFRKIPDDEDHTLQREAAARVLKLYYDVLPLQAFEEQFDVSTALAASLLQNEENNTSGEIGALRQLELEHLLHVAQCGPGSRWLTHHGSLQCSPLLTLLRLHAKDLHNRSIRHLIYRILSETSIAASNEACDALLAALSHFSGNSDIDAFLDDCFARAARQPVKYLDAFDNITANDLGEADKSSAVALGALVFVFLEQTPFVCKKDTRIKKEILQFIKCYLELLQHTGDKSAVLDAIFTRFAANESAVIKQKPIDAGHLLEQIHLPQNVSVDSQAEVQNQTPKAAASFPSPPVELDDHPELFKWSQKDLDIAIEDGDIDALILCLCSQYAYIRKQALTQLQKLEDQLLHSAIENVGPVYILIGELIETFEHNCLPGSESLPYIAGCFASHALHIQANPGHFLYPKINKFLNRGPSWRINKLPSYWIENTVLAQPEEDDAYWKEVRWVLDWLVDTMRTSADLEILRKTGVFEKTMALSSSSGISRHSQVRQRVLELLWRVTFVDGGSTTLVTRTGILAWLDMMREDTRVATELRVRILQTCDSKKVEEWSGLSIDSM